MPEKNKKKGKTSPKIKQLKDYKPGIKDYKSKNNREKKAEKNSHGKNRFSFILVILAIVLAIIIAALLIEFKIIKNPIKNPLAQPQLFVIEDRCSMIVGQLIHTIRDEDDCDMRCKTECDVREMRFHDSEFIKKENDCNGCKCYCK